MEEKLPALEIRVADCDIEAFALTGAETLDLDDEEVVSYVIEQLRDAIAFARSEQSRYVDWLRRHDV